VKDKNIEEILELYPKEGIYFFCQADNPRVMPSENLVKIAESHGIQGYSILNVNKALEYVTNLANIDDFIYVGGSTYVVAELDNI
jgi:dihydrofolate synthase/folylpolyglutamate synthase